MNPPRKTLKKRGYVETLYSRGVALEDDEALATYLAEKMRPYHERIASLEGKFGALNEMVATNTETTQKTHDGVVVVIEILEAIKGGLKLLGWVGGFVKWIAGVGAACVLLYSIYLGKFPWTK